MTCTRSRCVASRTRPPCHQVLDANWRTVAGRGVRVQRTVSPFCVQPLHSPLPGLPRAGAGPGGDPLRAPLLLAVLVQVRGCRGLLRRVLHCPNCPTLPTRWLSVNADSKTCPVCKAAVEEDKARRGGSALPQRLSHRLGGASLRPRRLREGSAQVACVWTAGAQPACSAASRSGCTSFHDSLSLASLPVSPQPLGGYAAGGVFGGMPAVFGFQGGPGAQLGALYAGILSPEQQQQAFLSRLLLMLGSFVIMCLLLF